MTVRLPRAVFLAALVLVATPVAASAQQAFSRVSTWLRAGPDSDYPAVGRVARGEPLRVYGCLSGRNWCDVAAGPDRGWLRGRSIDYVYGGRRVILGDPGLSLGIAVLRFGMADYWNQHYRGRSWYDTPRYWRGPDWDRRPRRDADRDRDRDRPRFERPRPDRGPDRGPDRPRVERPGPERPPVMRPGPDRREQDRPRVERPGPDRRGQDRPRVERPQPPREMRPQREAPRRDNNGPQRRCPPGPHSQC